MRCPKCHRAIPLNSRYCPWCEEEFNLDPSQEFHRISADFRQIEFLGLLLFALGIAKAFLAYEDLSLCLILTGAVIMVTGLLICSIQRRKLLKKLLCQ